MRSKFTRTDWRIVKTYKVNCTLTGFGTSSDATLWYYLYESNKGGRKLKYNSSCTELNLSKQKHALMTSLDVYNDTIYPWLSGRRIAEIPSYDDIPMEDTMNILKGK